MNRYRPLKELFLCRMRQFYREPEAIFWTYGFPVLMAAGLGLAFRNRPPQQVHVGVEDGPASAQIRAALEGLEGFEIQSASPQRCADLLRTGQVDILAVPGEQGYEYRFDPTRPEATMARLHLDNALQKSAGRQDALPVTDKHVTEPGARYIDFLVPGLIGLNLMGGGLWGVGFITVDMRIRKLLKRLVATPMRKSHFLMSVIGGRMVFTIPELFILIGFAWLVFKIAIVGSLLSILAVVAVGGVSFAGIGMLAASRAQKLETISGLMNLIMLPMWLLSGVFFSSARFPDLMQPFIQALPLTQLNQALRAVMLEGASLWAVKIPLIILLAWGLVCFSLALRWFRWT
ncbi:MAG: ABC transporter permease [Phycisphaerae bacterium]